MTDDDVVERLERYVANHPGADVMEVLVNTGVDPTQYRDVVEQLLAGEQPAERDVVNTESHTKPEPTGTSTEVITEPAGESHRGSVPARLDGLGQSFVPIDPDEKGPRVPRTEEYLREPDDDVFQAYLEAGHNYGVVTRDRLAVDERRTQPTVLDHQ